MKSIRRTIETILAAGVSAVLTIVYIVFVGRVLGPVDYADFSASLSLIYVFAIALTPVTPALARIVSGLASHGNQAAIRGVRRDVMRRAVIWLGALTLLGFVLSPFVAAALEFRSPLTFSLALTSAALFALLSIDRGVLQGLMHFRLYNANVLIESSLRCFGAILLLAVLPKSTNVALLSYVTAIAVAEAALALRLRHWLGVTDAIPADWKQIFGLALPLFALMMCVAVVQNADMLAVKRWLAPEESGLYGAATALAKGFGVLFVPLYVLSGPILSSLHEARRPLLATALRYEAWFLAVSAVPLLVVWAFPEAILRFLYGEQFIGAAPLLLPLAGISILTHSALMLVQLLITVRDFRFLAVYACMTVVQVTSLTMFHASAAQVLTVLYACQSITVLGSAGMIVLHYAQAREQ